ncbi:uncharacterized protein [Vulpes vulpes]|uniref:Uncharacterized protein isoform X2 n=1 Tax=Vulpes vulpes TaxID=9627 RepID=A0A3Q7U3I1_VULVU|nr:uncharacterized protein LOC112925328 [Vulpes vulpes]
MFLPLGSQGRPRGWAEPWGARPPGSRGRGMGPEHLLPSRQDEEQMSTRIYTPKWFPQCFLGRIPFSLTLKLWDVYTGWGVVLTAMAYTILKVHKMGPEEFPTRPLGLERVSLVPGPLLPSPASETLPRVEEQASPGPATQPELSGPPPCQAIVQLLPQRWNSLPILPVQQDGAGRRPPDMVGLKTKNGVPFPSAPAWTTPEAPQ